MVEDRMVVELFQIKAIPHRGRYNYDGMTMWDYYAAHALSGQSDYGRRPGCSHGE